MSEASTKGWGLYAMKEVDCLDDNCEHVACDRMRAGAVAAVTTQQEEQRHFAMAGSHVSCSDSGDNGNDGSDEGEFEYPFQAVIDSGWYSHIFQ